jgi:hypothetical protein
MDLHSYNVGPKDREQESRKTAGQMVWLLPDDYLTMDTWSTYPVTVEEQPKGTPSKTYKYFNLEKLFALYHGPINFAINIKILVIQVFWVVMLSHLVNSFWSFRGITVFWNVCMFATMFPATQRTWIIISSPAARTSHYTQQSSQPTFNMNYFCHSY